MQHIKSLADILPRYSLAESEMEKLPRMQALVSRALALLKIGEEITNFFPWPDVELDLDMDIFAVRIYVGKGAYLEFEEMSGVKSFCVTPQFCYIEFDDNTGVEFCFRAGLRGNGIT